MVGRANDASRVLEDQTIKAMSEAGEQVEDIARAIGRTTRHVSRRRKAMGCGRATVVLALQPLEGEVWKDRPDLRLKVSSLGRVACLRSNRLKAIIRNEEDRERGAAGYVSCYTRDGAKANKRFETLMLETFGREKPMRERTFSGRGSLPTSDSIWAAAQTGSQLRPAPRRPGRSDIRHRPHAPRGLLGIRSRSGAHRHAVPLDHARHLHRAQPRRAHPRSRRPPTYGPDSERP